MARSLHKAVEGLIGALEQTLRRRRASRKARELQFAEKLVEEDAKPGTCRECKVRPTKEGEIICEICFHENWLAVGSVSSDNAEEP